MPMTQKEKLQDRWTHNRITEAMRRVYVRKGLSTREDFKEITGKDY